MSVIRGKRENGIVNEDRKGQGRGIILREILMVNFY